ncbi:unnamed protein product [Dicrocoelium dendriticum]|nr:unnamed protein product [Dicrocoelium dendriticum]
MPHGSDKWPKIDLIAPEEKLPCTDIAFVFKQSDRKKLVAAYASGFIRVWHYRNNGTSGLSNSWRELEHSLSGTDISEQKYNQILCLSISSDNKRFVTGGSDTVVRLYELHSTSSGRLLIPKLVTITTALEHNFTSIRTDATFAHNYHSNRVTALFYYPTGGKDPALSHFFVSASWDGTIQGWDDRTNGSIWQYDGTNVAGADGLYLDAARGILLAASYKHDKVLAQVWDPNFRRQESRKATHITSKPLSTVAQDSSSPAVQVYVARLTVDGQFIIFGGTNANYLKLVSSTTLRPIATVSSLNSGVYSADSCLDAQEKRRLIVTFTNGCRIIHIMIDQKQQVSSDAHQTPSG